MKNQNRYTIRSQKWYIIRITLRSNFPVYIILEINKTFIRLSLIEWPNYMWFELGSYIIKSYTPSWKIKTIYVSTSKMIYDSNDFELKFPGLYRIKNTQSFHTIGEYLDLHHFISFLPSNHKRIITQLLHHPIYRITSYL
jgi:hypothetical protein